MLLVAVAVLLLFGGRGVDVLCAVAGWCWVMLVGAGWVMLVGAGWVMLGDSGW